MKPHERPAGEAGRVRRFSFFTADGIKTFPWLIFLRLLLPWLLIMPILGFFMEERIFTSSFTPETDRVRALLYGTDTIVAGKIANLRRDVLFLARRTFSAGYVENPNQANRTYLTDLFKAFSEASGTYNQIRFIAADGWEKVRVNYDDGVGVVVPDSGLQLRVDRYYFVNAIKLKAGEVYFSPLDLNIERGEIERPFKPTLRAATPVYDSRNRLRGIVIVNFLASEILEAVHHSVADLSLPVYLCNTDGFWFIAPKAEDEWGFMFDKKELSMASRYPEVWDLMQKKREGDMRTEDGFWIFKSLDPIGVGDTILQWRMAALFEPQTLASFEKPAVLESVLYTGLLSLFVLFINVRLALTTQQRNKALQEAGKTNADLNKTLENLRMIQNQLIQAERLSSLGLMVAGVSHELNTPLGAALMTASNLKGEGEILHLALQGRATKTELNNFAIRFDESLEMVLKNLEKSAGIIKSFKRLAADRANSDRHEFTISSLFADLERTSWRELKKQGAPFEIFVDQDVSLDSYPGVLSQVLENLVQNAVVHGYEGGELGPIALRARSSKKKNHLLITVEDKGKGIPEENLKSVFDPFFTTRRSKGGLGLGLHLVYQMVTDILGGEVRVESRIDAGTVFFVDLPLKAPLPKSGSAPA